MNKEPYSDPRKLLSLLRKDLRKELDLEPTIEDPDDIIHWRLK